MTLLIQNGKRFVVADAGKSVCRIDEEGPNSAAAIIMTDGETLDDFKDCEYAEMEEPMKYSVRSIIRELKAINKFVAVRQMLEAANYDWDFIGSNYLSDDDADFQTMLAAIVSQGILTQAELDTLLPKCIWSEV